MAWYPLAGQYTLIYAELKLQMKCNSVIWIQNVNILLQWRVFVQYSKQQALDLLDHLLQESYFNTGFDSKLQVFWDVMPLPNNDTDSNRLGC